MSELFEMTEREREVYRIAKAQAMREFLHKTGGYYGAVVDAAAHNYAKRVVLAQRKEARNDGDSATS
jgi:hypothetical protein